MKSFTDLIKSGDAFAVRERLETSPEVLNADIEGAPSPILLAVYHGQVGVAEVIRHFQPHLSFFEAAAMGDRHRIAELLGENPEWPTRVSRDGFSPLGLAAYFGHLEAVRDLLNAGADPNVASNNLMAVTPLHSALAGGHKEMARMLVEHGADVNTASGEGWTPLHYAASSGDIETARYLIDHHARREITNREGEMPAEVAQARGFADLEELLRPIAA